MSTSSSSESVSWNDIRFEELLRILELNKAIGDKKLKEFQARRAAVKERQDFLQQRRIARLRIEGIVIDLDAVKRRCKAPKESLWYEDKDEDEKKRLMRKRLKDMFKEHPGALIEEMPDSSSSDESVDEREAVTAVEEQPKRGQVLRNYTMFNKGGDKPTTKKVISEEIESGKNKSVLNSDKTETPTDMTNKHFVFNPKEETSAKVDKRVGVKRFQNAILNITAVNRMTGGRKSTSPSVNRGRLNDRQNRDRLSSGSGSNSPVVSSKAPGTTDAFPRVPSSGMNRKS